MPARQNNVSENSRRLSVTARMWLVQSFPAGAGALGGAAFQLDLPPLPMTLGPCLVKSTVDRQTVLRAATTPVVRKHSLCEDSLLLNTHLMGQVDL